MKWTEAVVIHLQEWGESDLIVEAFTRRWGRVKAVAKGAKRSRRRFMNKLEPFRHLRVLLDGEGRGLMRVDQADIIYPFFHISDELIKILQGFYLLELVQMMTPLRDPNPGILDLLIGSLRAVEEGRMREEGLRAYEMRLLELAGYRPRLRECLRCGGGLQGKAWFLLERGGVVCRDCYRGEEKAVPVSASTCASLEGLLEVGWQKVSFPGEVMSESRRLLSSFIEYQGGRGIRTLEVMKEMGIS